MPPPIRSNPPSRVPPPVPLAVRQLRLGPVQNFTYILIDEATRQSAVVDPGFEPDKVLLALKGTECGTILLTHGHRDHVAAVPQVKKATGARIVAHAECPVAPDVPVGDGDRIDLGETPLKVVATPGHQPDSVCFVAGGYVLTGDTLFVGECGRADLPGSDPRALWRSLLTVIRALDPALVVLPGHDYGKSPTSTLEREFRENYTLKPRTEEEFVEFVLAP